MADRPPFSVATVAVVRIQRTTPPPPRNVCGRNPALPLAGCGPHDCRRNIFDA